MTRWSVVFFWIGISTLAASTVLSIWRGPWWLATADGFLIAGLISSWLLSRRRLRYWQAERRRLEREWSSLFGNGHKDG